MNAQEGMTRKRVETEGGGSGTRRDQGIARRWACRRVQPGWMRCIIRISFTLVLQYLERVKNFMF